MKASIYQRAAENGAHLETTCVGISLDRWNELMKGARPANNRKATLAAIRAGVISEEQGREEIKRPYYNPYTHYVTRTHIIYVNSAIEHFIKVN